MQCRMNCCNINYNEMKKVEKFLKHIARLEPGCAPSSGYFEQIINEAREAKAEFEALHKADVGRRFSTIDEALGYLNRGGHYFEERKTLKDKTIISIANDIFENINS